MQSILVVDDEQGQRAILQRILKRQGYDVETAESGPKALEKIELKMFDVVVSDMRMTTEMEGRDLLREIKGQDPDLPVLIMTAFAELNDAVDLVAREGAFYYLEKPIDIDVLKKEVKRAVDSRVNSPSEGDEEQPVPEVQFETIIGQSDQMHQLFKIMSRIIHRGVNQVLITGDTGTGKEVIAKAIHQHGKRREEPFVPIKCSAIPDSLIESELFGYEKGAFTGAEQQKKGQFEIADGGTVFLDEIGDVPLGMQSKLLRV